MEELGKSTFEQELLASVFTGDIKKLNNRQMEKNRTKNEKEFCTILANSTSEQAKARKEVSKIFITF